MNYVYRYIDKADNIIKYIGIVCRDTENALDKRIYEHSYNDSWCQGKSWKIEYITVPTKNDAHALEGHFIALYGTNRWYNKAKTTLGLLSFVKNDFKWNVLYENCKVVCKKINRTLDDICIISPYKLPDIVAERYAEIRHSLIVIDNMLNNDDYSMFSREELIFDKLQLLDALEKYNNFLDSRKLCFI